VACTPMVRLCGRTAYPARLFRSAKPCLLYKRINSLPHDNRIPVVPRPGAWEVPSRRPEMVRGTRCNTHLTKPHSSASARFAMDFEKKKASGTSRETSGCSTPRVVRQSEEHLLFSFCALLARSAALPKGVFFVRHVRRMDESIGEFLSRPWAGVPPSVTHPKCRKYSGAAKVTIFCGNRGMSGNPVPTSRG